VEVVDDNHFDTVVDDEQSNLFEIESCNHLNEVVLDDDYNEFLNEFQSIDFVLGLNVEIWRFVHRENKDHVAI
jgi:hypothetical protein